MNLTGRAAIITGANQGLGLAIAQTFVSAGASVLLCARDAAKLKAALALVSAKKTPQQLVTAVPADVSQADDVQLVWAECERIFPQVHILVNNAGVYGPKGDLESIAWAEWVRAIEINLLGSVLMCRAVLPHFKARKYGKIIQLSGGGATAPLPRISAYAASKAAVVRFAETLAAEVSADNIDVNCIAPGALNTRLLDEVLEAGPDKVGRAFYERACRQKAEGGTPLEAGCRLAQFLASSASDGITGKLISAVWDPWETLDQHKDELHKTDIYTLRRIVPKDRGFTWGEK